MTDTRALVPVDRQLSISEVMTVGETMARSGFFSDARDAAQAVVKILAGQELGFGAFASMTGISIIQGKPAVGANLMAAALRRHGYNYRVVRLDNEGCEIAFFEGKAELGRSVFTKEDATAAGLVSKENWRKFPRNMYFARAMSNGVKWYCPDALGGGPVYTPDELGADVDDEGNVINVTPTAAPTTAATTQPAAPHTEHAPSNGGNKAHWSKMADSNGMRLGARFMKWATEDMSLSQEQVWEALAVNSELTEYTGTMQDARNAVEEWIETTSMGELEAGSAEAVR